MIRFRLRELLHEKGMTPYGFARDHGLDPSHVHRLATRQMPRSFRADTLDRLCTALNCHVGDLIEFVP